jgi:transposase, IS5 family
MREMTGLQASLIVTAIAHEHARELTKMGALLDEAPEVLGLVQADLLAGVKNPKTGRRGMNAEFVLRALIVKQMNGYSYDELAFHLADSATYQRFCRIGFCDTVPSAKTLQRNFKRVRPETLEAANRVLMRAAQRHGVELGDKLRGDCTVTKSNIHEPTDSSLLDDCVRVLTRAMHRARALVPSTAASPHAPTSTRSRRAGSPTSPSRKDAGSRSPR